MKSKIPHPPFLKYMFPATKQFTILEALNHVKQNISPKALTFDESFKTQVQTGNTVTANKLGEIELNEPIVDTTWFLRQITMAMYPNKVYPEEWTH
jgi:hypothetical protein